MKKKVGIITSYLDFDKNYGGVLQAYALSKQIEILGYDSYIMPYIYEFIPVDSKENKFIWKLFRKFWKAFALTNEQKKQLQMKKMMMEYVNTHLPIYKTSRMQIKDLSAISGEFYAFICGSDQVWSTKLQRDACDPGMFLKFVPNGIKKIAYAPSLGSTVSMSTETMADFREALSSFDAISVRENSGRKLILEVTNKDAPTVLDPTLLLPIDEWSKIEDKPKGLPEKYILVYRFGSLQTTSSEIQRVQHQMGIPAIEIPSSAVSLSDDWNKRYDINPGQFIGMIRNASLVCTDSFHATVFSILTKTPFITFYRQDPNNPNNMNSRINDLLSMTNLMDRIIKPGCTFDYNKLLDCNFDYAHTQINLRKKESLEYLKIALKDA